MFSIQEASLPGIVVLTPRVFTDLRDSFVKMCYRRLFQQLGLHFEPNEEFFLVSHSDVIRGMHFQVPPVAHAQFVYCISGSVLDVNVDLRRSSSTFGQCMAREISGMNHEMIFIPVGFADGFRSLRNDAVMVYQTSTVHVPEHGEGILWESFDFDQEGAEPCGVRAGSAFSRAPEIRVGILTSCNCL